MNTEAAVSKCIFSESDVAIFRKSLAYKNIVHTIFEIAEKVKGCDVPPILNNSIVTRCKPKEVNNFHSVNKPIANMPLQAPMEGEEIEIFREQEEYEQPKPQIIEGMGRIFKFMNDSDRKTELSKTSHRFGDPAFKNWYAAVESNISALISDNVELGGNFDSQQKKTIYAELCHYLMNSFGSPIRIDYGTGHELSFVSFVGSLIKLQIIDLEIIKGELILEIFAKYYDLVRGLILKYNLEPAGTHGVWGLDDHFHFIYILGAAQFDTASTSLKPAVSQVLSSAVIDRYKLKNLYINAIAFIYKIKRGPFNEHSPILFDIQRNVTRWSKVLTGLQKMYDYEVLSKFPVIQHFYFGKFLYPWIDAQTGIAFPISRSEENSTAPKEDYERVQKLNSSGHDRSIPVTRAPW